MFAPGMHRYLQKDSKKYSISKKGVRIGIYRKSYRLKHA